MNQFPPLGPNKDKFTPELRILVASLLSMVVILLWAKFFAPKPPAHPQQQNKPAVSAPATPGPPAILSAARWRRLLPPTASATDSAATNAAAVGDSQERTDRRGKRLLPRGVFQSRRGGEKLAAQEI